MPPERAYHLVPEPWYRGQPAHAPYLPEAFERDGFVHLTHGLAEVLAVANRYYRDDPRPYLLLTIDLARLGAAVRHDDGSGLYPHVYGPLDRAAIVAVARVDRDAGGVFTGVAPLST